MHHIISSLVVPCQAHIIVTLRRLLKTAKRYISNQLNPIAGPQRIKHVYILSARPVYSNPAISHPLFDLLPMQHDDRSTTYRHGGQMRSGVTCTCACCTYSETRPPDRAQAATRSGHAPGLHCTCPSRQAITRKHNGQGGSSCHP